MTARFLFAALLGSLGGQAAAEEVGQGATIMLSEIQVPDAMALKDRLLPAAIAGAVEAGRITRQWLPGEAHLARYREPARDAGERLCTMTVHAVALNDSGPLARRDESGNLALTIGPVESGETFAVRPEGSNAACGPELPYIARQTGLGGEWQEAAYRRLLDWIERAQEAAEPGIALECKSEQPADCTDPRASLAALPLETLLYIQVVNPRRIVQSQQGAVRVVVAQPLAHGEPHEVTVALGMSGEDGHSWRLTWIEDSGAVSSVRMTRSYIVYH